MATNSSYAALPTKSNVVVAVRVRPLNPAEANNGAKPVVRVQGDGVHITDPMYSGSEKVFTYDYAFWSVDKTIEFASQETVYNHIGKSMLAHAFQGFNTCIFAYGQTGAGKTYTMMGWEADRGIIPRACEDLFRRIADNTSAEVNFKVELSYFEIYNEKVRCLLNPHPSKNRDLRVREHPVTGPYVEGLTRLIVQDYEDVTKWLQVGNQARTVAATKHNQHSSRSHSVFTLILTQTKIDEDGHCTDLVSKINLVDLAGSERCGQTVSSTSSELFKEGVNINKSLSTLGRVIHALSDQSNSAIVTTPSSRGVDHDTSSISDGEGSTCSTGKKRRQWIAYRDSVLTWLLKENLGGNSKTFMLATLSPASCAYEESLNTMRYADRVKYIRNEAVINEDQNARLIRELKEEIDYLRQQLCSQSERAGSPGRRSSYSIPLGHKVRDEEEPDHELKHKLDTSDRMIQELNHNWEERMKQATVVYRERLQQVEKELVGKSSVGFTVPKLPMIINLCPHPVPGEQLAHSLKAGETYLGTDDEEITEETKDDIRLSDGFNLSNPHCIFDHHSNGEVEIVPLNGSLTYVNGQLLTTTFILQHGCRVVLGSNHIFMFVDGSHSRAIRQKIKERGSGVPRVIDWEFASKEFADTMDLVCKPDTLQILRHEKELIAEEWEKLRNAHEKLAAQLQEYRNSPFLVQRVTNSGNSEGDSPSTPTHRLMWHLAPGRNTIGFGGDVNPPGAKQLILLNYDQKSGHVSMLQGSRSASSLLTNGAEIVSGDAVFQLILPAEDRNAEMQAIANKAVEAQRNGEVLPPNTKLPEGVLEEYLFLEDLRQKVFELQFSVLNLHDQLFPPPPQQEGEAARPQQQLTPEEAEREDKRKALREDWILSSKKITGRDIIQHICFLLHELRWLTYVSAQREQTLEQLTQQSPDAPDVDPRIKADMMVMQNELLKLQKYVQRVEAEKVELERVTLAMGTEAEALERLQQEVDCLNKEKSKLLEEIDSMNKDKESVASDSPTEDLNHRLAADELNTQLEAMTKKYEEICAEYFELQKKHEVVERSFNEETTKRQEQTIDVKDANEKLLLAETELQISKEIGMQQEQELMRLKDKLKERDREKQTTAASGPHLSELQAQILCMKGDSEMAAVTNEQQHVYIRQLQEELTQANSSKVQLINELEKHSRQQDENKQTRHESQQKLKELQEQLDLLTKQNLQMNDAYYDLQKKYQESEKHSIETEDYTRLDEDMKAMGRKLQVSETRSLTLQQKLESRTTDYDNLYFTHQKLKEETDASRERLQQDNDKLRGEVEELRKQIKILHQHTPGSPSGTSLPKDSIKAFNKMKETIKLLTKVAKSKDEKIAKLEKEMGGKTEIMSTLNTKLLQSEGTFKRLSQDPPTANLDDPSTVCMDRIQILRENMDYAIQLIKGEVIHMNRSTVPLYDKVIVMVSKVGGSEVFKRAMQFIKKIVVEVAGEGPYADDKWPITEQDFERIKSHHRSNIIKSLREMVVSYDMLPDYIKGGIITYDEISKNCKILVQMSKFCAQYERARRERERDSPLRPAVSPSGERPGEGSGSSKRSSSAHKYGTPASLPTPTSSSSQQSAVNTSIQNVSYGDRRDASPTVKYANVRSRVAAYISPKRSSPVPPQGGIGSSSIRTTSPRPSGSTPITPSTTVGIASTQPTTSSARRTFSPRPGTTTPPASTRSKKSASPEPTSHLRSLTPNAHTNSASPRTNSPSATPRNVPSTTTLPSTVGHTHSSRSPAKRKGGSSGGVGSYGAAADAQTSTNTHQQGVQGHHTHVNSTINFNTNSVYSTAHFSNNTYSTRVDVNTSQDSNDSHVSLTGGALPPPSPDRGYTINPSTQPTMDDNSKRVIPTTSVFPTKTGFPIGGKPPPGDAPSPTYPPSPKDSPSAQMAHKGTYEIPGTINDLRQQTSLRKAPSPV